MSLPTGERGLKSSIPLLAFVLGESLPTGERGLKLIKKSELKKSQLKSLPTGERGLKYL